VKAQSVHTGLPAYARFNASHQPKGRGTEREGS
jgi:hypothetical protein